MKKHYCVVYFANGCGELRETTRKCNNQEFPEKQEKTTKQQKTRWTLEPKRQNGHMKPDKSRNVKLHARFFCECFTKTSTWAKYYVFDYYYFGIVFGWSQKICIKKQFVRYNVFTFQIWQMIPNTSSTMVSSWSMLTPHTWQAMSWDRPKKTVSKKARSIWQGIPNMGTRMTSTPSKSHSPIVSAPFCTKTRSPHAEVTKAILGTNPVFAPHEKAPSSPPVVPFQVLFFTAAPLSCTFTFRPQKHSLVPAYRWNDQKLAQQPLLSTKREPKHLGDTFGNHTVYIITSSEARCFTKTSSFCPFSIFPVFFPCFCRTFIWVICTRSCFSWHGLRKEQHPSYAREHAYKAWFWNMFFFFRGEY